MHHGWMSPEIEMLTRFFAAINRNDMEAMARDFDAEIVRVEPEGYPTSGTYRGIEAVREQVAKGRGTWAEGSCNPEAFHANGEKVVVYVHAWVRLHGATEWMGGRFADGFTVRDGKIAEYITFWRREDAMAWAGLSAAP